MSNLLFKPSKPDEHGRIHPITPESDGWTYVGFEVYRLESGQSLKQATGDREACIVLLSGKARVAASGQDFGTIGGRSSPFKPDQCRSMSPARSEWSLKAETDCEIAVCTAPAEGKLPARVIAPDQVGQETRGKGRTRATCATSCRRRVGGKPARGRGHHAVRPLVELSAAQARPGHVPDKSLLEETYYHRLNPPSGFALQRVYTDDRSLDETLAATMATWCWCRRAIIRSARRMATSSIIST